MDKEIILQTGLLSVSWLACFLMLYKRRGGILAFFIHLVLLTGIAAGMALLLKAHSSKFVPVFFLMLTFQGFFQAALLILWLNLSKIFNFPKKSILSRSYLLAIVAPVVVLFILHLIGDRFMDL